MCFFIYDDIIGCVTNQPIGGGIMKSSKVKDLIDLLSQLDSEKEIIFISVGPFDNAETKIEEIEISESENEYKILVMG